MSARQILPRDFQRKSTPKAPSLLQCQEAVSAFPLPHALLLLPWCLKYWESGLRPKKNRTDSTEIYMLPGGNIGIRCSQTCRHMLEPLRQPNRLPRWLHPQSRAHRSKFHHTARLFSARVSRWSSAFLCARLKVVGRPEAASPLRFLTSCLLASLLQAKRRSCSSCSKNCTIALLAVVSTTASEARLREETAVRRPLEANCRSVKEGAQGGK